MSYACSKCVVDQPCKLYIGSRSVKCVDEDTFRADKGEM